MTQSYSRPRQQAEAAFAKAQSQFLARNRTVSEVDSIIQAREEKTLRLKKARLAKETEDRAKGVTALLSQRPKRA